MRYHFQVCDLYIEFSTLLILCCLTLSHFFLAQKALFGARKQALNRRSRKRIATNVDAAPKKVVAPREKLWLGLKIPGAKKKRMN